MATGPFWYCDICGAVSWIGPGHVVCSIWYHGLQGRVRPVIRQKGGNDDPENSAWFGPGGHGPGPVGGGVGVLVVRVHEPGVRDDETGGPA